jgi:hypothetical protein
MVDNVTAPVAGTKFKTKDTGSNGHLAGHVLYDEAEAEVIGKVTASPTANTVLGRLKDILSLVVLAAGSNIIGKVGIDQTTPGTTNGVQVNAALPAGTNNIGDVDVLTIPALAAGTNLIGKVKTKFIVATASAMTRPGNTTPYSINDAVSNNGTAGSVTAISLTVSDVNDDHVALDRCRVASDDTGVAGKAFRVWFYRSDPTASSGIVGGDNAGFSTKQGTFIGSMSGTFKTFSDGSVAVCVPDEGARIICKPTSGAATVFALLQTLEAFTPSANSTTFTLTVEGFQGAA